MRSVDTGGVPETPATAAMAVTGPKMVVEPPKPVPTPPSPEPAAPPPAPPPVTTVVEISEAPVQTPPPIRMMPRSADDDPDRQALARLGLSSRPLEPSVLAVQPPGWLADGWRMMAMVENKPPFHSVATLDHCLKVLVRQAGDDALVGVEQCAHGFSIAGSYHAQHCVVCLCDRALPSPTSPSPTCDVGS